MRRGGGLKKKSLPTTSGLRSNKGLDRGDGLSASKKGILPKSAPSLLDTADRVFSLYIRNKYADEDKMVKCYTCTMVLPVLQIQCGHFVPRGRLDTRFNENNCRPQCPFCNENLQGNLEVFEEKLTFELGEMVVSQLKSVDLNFTLTNKYLQKIIDDYGR